MVRGATVGVQRVPAMLRSGYVANKTKTAPGRTGHPHLSGPFIRVLVPRVLFKDITKKTNGMHCIGDAIGYLSKW